MTLCGCHDGRDGVIVDDYRCFRSIHIVVVVVVVFVEVKSLERPFEGSYRCSGISRSKGLRNGRVADILVGGRSWKSARQRGGSLTSHRDILLFTNEQRWKE